MNKDKIIFSLIEKENQRQINGIELIASENFMLVLPVMECRLDRVLTNKYAEGYPGKSVIMVVVKLVDLIEEISY